MKLVRLSGVVLASLVLSLSVHAQEQSDDRPVISASATGTVAIEADYAVLTLGVDVQDSTPTLAAREMDNRLRGLTDTLVSLGTPRDSLPTARYHIAPNKDRDQAQQIVGYTATAAVRLSIWDMTRIPTLIEAALAAGATDVTGLQFFATDEREARDEALRQALAEANRDARVLAEAAGGHLGDVIEISTSESGRVLARAAPYSGVGRALELSAAVTPRAIVVNARVTGRWSFEKK